MKPFCFACFFPFSLGLLLERAANLKENQRAQCKGLGDGNPGLMPASIPGTRRIIRCCLFALRSLAGVAYQEPRGA